MWARRGTARYSVVRNAFRLFFLPSCAVQERFGEVAVVLAIAFAVVLAVAVAVAVARAPAFRLLTSPAVERAEHRSGTRGEEAHVFERSELCAVPSFHEERRAPLRCSRIGPRPAVLDQPFGCWKSASFGYLFFARAKKSNSLPEGERKLLLLPSLVRLFPSEKPKAAAKSKARAKAFAPASHERATFLYSCKEKVAKRKHALPPRPTRYARGVHSAAGIFRHDIHVVSKNGVRPCTPPLMGSHPSAPSLRKGTRKSKAGSNSNSKI